MKEKRDWHVRSTKETYKYITGLDGQVSKNKYCSRLNSPRQITQTKSPLDDGGLKYHTSCKCLL